ncbi:MAG TPA: PDDEXK nuclease domain-containing protein [Panacibacter sp.]|nr:PDDEXK nuclease domain-containing protein [Panacibacter sp.]
MASKNSIDISYQQWLADLKEKIRNSQMKAALKVNTEMLSLYWEIGKELTEKQIQSNWGDKIITQLAKDLLSEFPGVKGFSATNLKYIRKWYQFYNVIGQQAVDQLENASSQSSKKTGQQVVDQTKQKPFEPLPAFLEQIPWGHHIQIISKTSNTKEAIFYVNQTVENNWSRSVLVHQIESGLYNRKGNAITNFENTLPKAQSDLAKETLKNPYLFDFLGLTDEIQERELEKALINHIKKFMLELGRGFAYVGNQYNLNVEGDDYFLDLLFYNYHLHCFVVFELKVGDFKPEFAGKLNFYINTVNAQIKGTDDKPTIGVLLCKTPNTTVVKYSLLGIDTPIGVSEYEFTKALPKQLKSEMPTVEELELELEKETIEFKEHLNPVDARLQAIKEKLKGIKTDEIQITATYQILQDLFKNGLKPLYQQIIVKLFEEFKEEFANQSLSWDCNRQIVYGIEEVDAFWQKEENLKKTKELGFSYRLNGFKKGGTEIFNEALDLKFEWQEYWYGFTLFGHNNQQPFLKKLYHQQLTKEDKQAIVDLLMVKVMDRIDWIMEHIKKNNS